MNYFSHDVQDEEEVNKMIPRWAIAGHCLLILYVPSCRWKKRNRVEKIAERLGKKKLLRRSKKEKP